jgi:hypothetical protein
MSQKVSASENYDADWLIGALTRLQVRYPQIVRALALGDLSVDIAFFVEDMAMQCAQSLLDQGITVVHRLDRPRTISLQIPSLVVQEQVLVAHDALESFFQKWSQPGPLDSTAL